MPDSNLRQRLQRALSSLDEARAGARKDPAAAGSKLRKAQQALDAVRDAIGRHAADRAKALRGALAEQERLVERVTAGTLEPRDANERNRPLHARVRELRKEIGELNALAALETPAQAGGEVERPLDTPAGVPTTPRLGIDLKPTPLGFCIWAVVFLAAIAGPLAYRGFIRFGAPVQIDAVFTDPGAVTVVCRNLTPRSVTFCAPWPDEMSAKPDPSEGSKRYGIVCGIREHGAADHRVIVPPLDAWVYSGIPLRAPETFILGPDMSLELRVDVDKLGQLGALPESLRFTVTDTTGRAVATAQVELPSHD